MSKKTEQPEPIEEPTEEAPETAPPIELTGDDVEPAPQIDGSPVVAPTDISNDAEEMRALERFRRTAPHYDVNILDAEIDNGRVDLVRYRDNINKAIENIPDDKRSHRLFEVRETFLNNRTVRMDLLNEAVEKQDLDGAGLEHRTALRSIIKSLPEV